MFTIFYKTNPVDCSKIKGGVLRVFVMFSISAMGPGATEATELKEKFEALMKEYKLEGNIQGKGFEQFAQYSGNYKK